MTGIKKRHFNVTKEEWQKELEEARKQNSELEGNGDFVFKIRKFKDEFRKIYPNNIINPYLPLALNRIINKILEDAVKRAALNNRVTIYDFDL